MTLAQKIEALLFYMTEPVSAKKIAKMLGDTESAVTQAIAELQQQLVGRGVALIHRDDEYLLSTHPDAHELIAQIRKDQVGGDLSKAALETLTIILYRSQITKPEIDYIRGVNSNYILRHLTLRGLVEKTPNPDDKRSPLYQPTFETFQYLGITSVDELPGYQDFMNQLDTIHASFIAETTETGE